MRKFINVFLTLVAIGLLYSLPAFAHGNSYHNNYPTPTPTIAPSCTPTPTILLIPTISVIPTPETQATETSVPSNTSGNMSTTQTPGPAVCTIPFAAPILQGFKSNGGGSVTFSWWGVPNIDKYSIIYGYASNALDFGEDNIPNTSTSITLNDLQPGNSVWAIVGAWRNGCVENSNELDPLVL